MYPNIPDRSTRLSCFKPSRAIGKLVSLLWSRWISLREEKRCRWVKIPGGSPWRDQKGRIEWRFWWPTKSYLRFFSCCSDMGMDWMRLNERFRFSSFVSFPVSWKFGLNLFKVFGWERKSGYILSKWKNLSNPLHLSICISNNFYQNSYLVHILDFQ